MRSSGRPPAPFAVAAAAAARPPPGASHRKAAAAARSRAALALVLLVSAAAFFFVVNAARGGSGAGGIDADATPFSSSASSRPSVRTSVGTRSVSASGGAEGTSDTKKAAENTAATEGAGDGATSSSLKKSSAPPLSDPVSVFFARPVRELRHDGSAFTQGLEFDRICSGPYALPPDSAKGGGCRDVFWESTGLNGRSTVRLVDLESGKPLRTAKLPDDAFGEGLTKVPFSGGGGKGGERNNASSASSSGSSAKLLQLTWLSGRAFWHDADALLNSSDSYSAPKNPVEALGGAIDDALNRRTGGAASSTKKGSSSASSVSEETRTPLGDGWGAAFVPAASAVALSDGSSRITFADARNVSRALRTITVTDEGGGEGEEGGAEKKKRVEVFNLNELEWVPAGAVRSLLSSSSSSSSSSDETAAAEETKASPSSLFGLGGEIGGGGSSNKKSKGIPGNASLSDGELWANVWGTPCVARVDPLSGAVVGWVLAPDLRPRALAAAASAAAPFSSSSNSNNPQGQIDVLNGIAVDDGAREAGTPPLHRARLFLTGKNWPLLFEVRLERAGGGGGGGGAGGKEGGSSSSSSSEQPSSSSSSSSSSQQQAALTAARASCIRPVADFG